MADNEDELDEGSEGRDDGNRDKDRDGKWVPYDRFKQVNGKLKDLQRELTELKGQANKQPAKVFSSAELRALVDEGKLTETQAEAIREKQLEEKLEARVENKLADRERKSAAIAQIAEYEALQPDLADEDSDLRHRVTAEYEDLVRLGADAGEATLVAALRAVCGPLSTLKKGKKPERKTEHNEDHDSDADPAGKTGKKVKLSAAERAYYEPLVQRGMYTWDDVGELVTKFAKPHLRRMRGAQV